MIAHTEYSILTGFEGTGRCFWCGGELKGKLKRYCYGHMTEYYQHFEWGSASRWALKRAGQRCENCGDNYKMEVHHIVPLKGKKRYFTAFNLPWNLIAFCHSCHQTVHAIMRGKTAPLDSWEKARSQGQAVMVIA